MNGETPHAPEPGVALESDDELLARFVRTRDPDLREELAIRYAPLAEGLARRYANRGERLEDLQQVAYLGLLKALDGFDDIRGSQLPRLRRADDPRRAAAPLPRQALGDAGPA